MNKSQIWQHSQLNDGVNSFQNRQLEVDASIPTRNHKIYIPQHPRGRPKEIAMFDDNGGGRCRIRSNNERGCTAGERDISYTCDTEGGSSGSPVISHTTHKVIGIHHCGGGCNGNKGVPIHNVIDKISYHLSGTLTGTPPGPAPTTISPVYPLEEHCLKYGDSIFLQVDNMDRRWLAGGYNKGQNEVDTRDFTGENYFTFKWIVKNVNNPNRKIGKCVHYNDKVYIENQKMTGMWLRGGIEARKQRVKIGDRSGNKKQYQWTVEKIPGINNLNANYGDRIYLKINNSNIQWLSGGRAVKGKKGRRVIASNLNKDSKKAHYRWTVRSNFGNGERNYKDPFAP